MKTAKDELKDVSVEKPMNIKRIFSEAQRAVAIKYRLELEKLRLH